MKLNIKFSLSGFDVELEESKENVNIIEFLDNLINFINNKKELLDQHNLVSSTDKFNKEVEIYDTLDKSRNLKSEKSPLIIDSQKFIDKTKRLASEFFNFTPEGDIIYKMDINNLTNLEQIYLITLAKYLLYEEKLTENEIITSEEVSDKSNLDIQQVRSRLADLVNEKKLIRVSRGEYKANIFSAPEYLESIIKTYYKSTE